MNSCSLGYLTLLSVQIMCGFCYNKLTANKIAEIFYEMKQNTKSLSRKSHLHCFSECMRRNACVFISSTNRPDLLIADPFKCHLYLANSTIPAKTTVTCTQQYLPIAVIPKVVAGACSDHKCNAADICIPNVTGYKCKLEKRRSNRKKSKKKKKHSSIPNLFG